MVRQRVKVDSSANLSARMSGGRKVKGIQLGQIRPVLCCIGWLRVLFSYGREPLTNENVMKFKHATMLAIVGTGVTLVWNFINFLHNIAGAEQVPLFYLLSLGSASLFQLCLLIFFIALYRTQ